MKKKLNPQKVGGSDHFQTPPEAFEILKPFIPKDSIIWECAWGKGKLAEQMSKDFRVVGDHSVDFLISKRDCDIIVTNPPYSIKDEFIQRCYELNKPFALLMPLTALEGQKRQEVWKRGLQLIIPNKRINFETPSGEGSGAWFMTAWFCYGLNLPKDINFVELNKNAN